MFLYPLIAPKITRVTVRFYDNELYDRATPEAAVSFLVDKFREAGIPPHELLRISRGETFIPRQGIDLEGVYYDYFMYSAGFGGESGA
jgi:hypothetical protein